MKLLLIGDPHFKVDNAPETEELTRHLISAAEFHRPNYIVILGDTLDRHEHIHVHPLTRAINMIRDLSIIAPVYLIIGNHDRPNNSDFLSEQHPFNALKDWARVTVVDKVVQQLTDEGYNFIYVPYVPPGRFEEALQTYSYPERQGYQQATAIFAHQEFRGAQMGVVESTNGDKWPKEYPLVISGHIHEYNIPQKNIIYTGTAYQTSFGDHSHKTISIFEWEGPNQPPKETRLDLKLIRKEVIELECSQIYDWTPPDLTRIRLKLKIKGTSEEIKAIMKYKKIKEWQKMGIKIVYQTVTVNKSSENIDLDKQTHISYLDLLWKRIQNQDEEVKKWYQELFS